MRALIFVVLFCGCSLTERSTPVPNRYFTPEIPTAHASAEHGTIPLRLDRVTSSSALRDRIVHRDSPVELGMYETLRWTDNPEVFVRESLDRALFERGPFRSDTDEDTPALDIDVLAFEEARSGHARAGLVRLRWHLNQDGKTIASGVASAEKPARANDIDSIVVAISNALREATSQVVRDVLAQIKTG